MEQAIRTTTSDTSLIRALNWRYATKKFDSAKKISSDTLETLLEATRLSASSMGLQPYNLLHIQDPDLRAELREASSNQSQITDASDMIVFAAKTKIEDEYIRYFVELGAEARGYSASAVEKRFASIQRYVQKKGGDLLEWNARQAYIAMGQLLTSAAILEVDACPMEGINTNAYDRILGLETLNLTSLAVVTLGYRAEDDAYARKAKVRIPAERMIKTYSNE